MSSQTYYELYRRSRYDDLPSTRALWSDLVLLRPGWRCRASSGANQSTLYSIGVALTDALDDLISEGRIAPQLAMKILSNFDRSITDILAQQVSAKLSFKVGELQYPSFVWWFPESNVTDQSRYPGSSWHLPILRRSLDLSHQRCNFQTRKQSNSKWPGEDCVLQLQETRWSMNAIVQMRNRKGDGHAMLLGLRVLTYPTAGCLLQVILYMALKVTTLTVDYPSRCAVILGVNSSLPKLQTLCGSGLLLLLLFFPPSKDIYSILLHLTPRAPYSWMYTWCIRVKGLPWNQEWCSQSTENVTVTWISQKQFLSGGLC